MAARGLNPTAHDEVQPPNRRGATANGGLTSRGTTDFYTGSDVAGGHRSAKVKPLKAGATGGKYSDVYDALEALVRVLARQAARETLADTE